MGYLFESEVYWGGGEFRWTCHRRGGATQKRLGTTEFILTSCGRHLGLSWTIYMLKRAIIGYSSRTITCVHVNLYIIFIPFDKYEILLRKMYPRVLSNLSDATLQELWHRWLVVACRDSSFPRSQRWPGAWAWVGGGGGRLSATSHSHGDDHSRGVAPWQPWWASWQGLQHGRDSSTGGQSLKGLA